MTEYDESGQVQTHCVSTVVLRCQPVELYKILKFEGLAGSGAEAKQLIDDGQVRVNGQAEHRRRRKIVASDRIDYAGHQLLIVVDDAG
ncbi:MAG: RNA-binding S4 domain-containing protein [Granulosicoccus sp.]|nr:RNA-binding S4 domain-containing protein [Granulosicoccus sp.]